MYKLELENGKYTVIEDLNNGKFEALRYGDEWRNLGAEGDNLILALVYKIQELEEKLKSNNENSTIDDIEEEAMDIYCKEGTKIKFINDGGWTSYVTLKEFPKKAFNTVLFAEVGE